jgi:putative ABC transport system ATP-binding protein
MTTLQALQARGLEVRYGDVVAVHPLDLELTPGTLLAVTGPSGAGKSSLLWALAGAVAAYAGSVTLAGEPIGDRSASAARGVVVAPQGNGLAAMLTAAENIIVPLIGQGIDGTEADARATSALMLVGLEDSGNHLVEELSGGQQQRVALARAFAAAGTVVLADEPTSDLDATNRNLIIAALRAEAERGAIVVVSTHDPEAAAQCDAELTLDEGHAVWRTEPRGMGHTGG